MWDMAMEVQDGGALLAGFRVMEPPSVVVSLARKLGGGVVSTDAQTFLLEKCFNDEERLILKSSTIVEVTTMGQVMNTGRLPYVSEDAKTCRRYPPAWLYLRRTLKQIILAAEKDGEEVLDGLYELHAVYLLPSQDRGSEIAPKCYKSYTYRVPRAYLACKTGSQKVLEEVERPITLRVSLNMLEGDTGCCTWPAGLYLSEFILSHPELFYGQKCLEVGSGAGIVGILLARLAASKVLLTDGSLTTLANLRHNLSINGVKVEGIEGVEYAQEPVTTSTRVECQQLLWEKLPGKELQALDSNIILGADLIYDPTYIPHLVHMLASLLSLGHPVRTNGCEDSVHEFPVAYIASAIRNPGTLIFFVETVERAGLRMVEVSESMRPAVCFPEISGFDRARILIHRLQAWRD